MWTAKEKKVTPTVTQTMIEDGSGLLSFRGVVKLWHSDPGFRKYFSGLLQESPFEAYFWEAPPVTVQTLDRPFEYVLVEAPELLRLRSDATAFMGHFLAHPWSAVLSFPNLGGDATLVVPAPLVEEGCYTHLGKFLRHAPMSQVDEFWSTVGAAMLERVSMIPVWLSAAGMGVSWLHLRLDSRPKYYRYEPYRLAHGDRQ